LVALTQRKIVFFDGVCNLCNGTVDFLLRHHRDQFLMFAPLQGVSAKNVLKSNSLASIVYYEQGLIYERSDAALKLCEGLALPWRIFLVFKLVPKAIRDKVYDFIAINRYRIFGKNETCRIPSEQERSRFLD